MKLANCKSCGAAIYWVEMPETGKRMPVDAQYDSKSVKVTSAGVEITTVRKSHFATCPDANSHRKARP